MKSWILKTIVTGSVFTLALLGLVLSPAAHAAPAVHHSAAHPATCTGATKVEDVYYDANDTDLVFVEAQLYQNSCNQVYSDGISEIDAGCIFGSYCHNYSLRTELVGYLNGQVYESYGFVNMPNDGNYHGWNTGYQSLPCQQYVAITNVNSSDGSQFTEETNPFYAC